MLVPPRQGFGVSLGDSPCPGVPGSGGRPSTAVRFPSPKPRFRARDRRGGCGPPWETPVTQGAFAPASAPSSFLAAGSGHCGEKASPVPPACGEAGGETEARPYSAACGRVRTPSCGMLSPGRVPGTPQAPFVPAAACRGVTVLLPPQVPSLRRPDMKWLWVVAFVAPACAAPYAAGDTGDGGTRGWGRRGRRLGGVGDRGWKYGGICGERGQWDWADWERWGGDVGEPSGVEA